MFAKQVAILLDERRVAVTLDIIAIDPHGNVRDIREAPFAILVQIEHIPHAFRFVILIVVEGISNCCWTASPRAPTQAVLRPLEDSVRDQTGLGPRHYPVEKAGNPAQVAYSSGIDLRLYSPDFTIVDENEDFLLVDKPPHLMVHPSVPGNPPTLLDGLQAMCAYELVCGGQLSLINRLDRETSGIVLVAKHRAAARDLSKAMERREFRKSYHAIVWGWPEADDFVVDGPLLRKGEIEPSPIWVKQMVHPGGKASRTRFEVESRFERATSNGSRFSVLRCYPLTGRMHQIRVHASFAGHPIVGDKIYGPDEQCYLDFIETGWTAELENRLLMSRQALHASGLGWREHEWKCGLPADMRAFSGD